MLDDTLIYVIIGDNGASAEGSLQGTFNEMITLGGFGALETPEFLRTKIDDLGGPEAYNHYAVGWAHAMDTPYQWTKQVASHWGGTRNGTIVHWPSGIKAKGEIRTQFHHVIDVAPDDPRGRRPARSRSFVNGVQQKPIEGVSMAYSFNDARRRRAARDAVLRDVRQPRHLPQGLDRGDQAPHAVGDRRATSCRPAFDDDVWELYDTTADWTQARDLAAGAPRQAARAAAAVADRGRQVQRACPSTTGSSSAACPRARAGRRWSGNGSCSSPAWAASRRTPWSCSRTPRSR